MRAQSLFCFGVGHWGWVAFQNHFKSKSHFNFSLLHSKFIVNWPKWFSRKKVFFSKRFISGVSSIALYKVIHASKSKSIDGSLYLECLYSSVLISCLTARSIVLILTLEWMNPPPNSSFFTPHTHHLFMYVEKLAAVIVHQYNEVAENSLPEA